MNLLVTGGAGYIGSHTHHLLVENGHQVTVLDDLSTGHRWAIHPEAEFIDMNLSEKKEVSQLLKSKKIEAVFHFAGRISVEESTRHPADYFHNNSVHSFHLINSCLENGVGKFIFSSTAATYGIPQTAKISEETPQNPINPYGLSKLMTEQMLNEISKTSEDFRFVNLRYFNACGAKPDGSLGQLRTPAIHLIPIACQAALGQREKFTVFGNDYPTPDGTCVRDYIHIMDLAQAHLDALTYLANGGASESFNCGYGKGYSILEVLEGIEKVAGRKIPRENGSVRKGDPPELIANSEKIRRILNWTPQFESLEKICETAFQWEKKVSANPDQYQSRP